jgi:glycosyltransferase involved in cell wall biosynthesis
MISVVVPLHNEEEAAPLLAQKLSDVFRSIGHEFELIFVDDGSLDETLKRLVDTRQSIPQLKIVELSRRHGQTGAIAAGIDNARGDVIITMDGDLQHDPNDIPRFLEKLKEGYDLVSGWRQVRTDSAVIRRFPSKLANSLMRWVSGVQVRDFGSTFKAYKASILKRIELFGELHRFIPVLAAREGARIAEIPISVHPRKVGYSKYSLSRTFGVFEDIFFLSFFTHHLTKPIRAFGRLFFIFFGTGFLISAVLMGLWLIGQIAAVWEHSAMLLFSVFMMTVGFQFLVVGILAEILMRIYHHTSQTHIYSVRQIHG